MEDVGAVPPVLYVPARHAGVGRVDVELSTLVDGRVAALAYTSLDRLVDACGDAQPWALLPTEQLSELQASGAVSVIAVDPEVLPALRKEAGDV